MRGILAAGVCFGALVTMPASSTGACPMRMHRLQRCLAYTAPSELFGASEFAPRQEGAGLRAVFLLVDPHALRRDFFIGESLSL